MKKGWKIFWIVCICVVLAGIAFCIAGAVLGATREGIRSVLQSERIDRSVAEYKETHERSEKTDDAGQEGKTADAGQEGESLSMEYQNVRSLDVEVACPNVVVEEYTGSQIQVKTSGIPQNIQNDLSFYEDEDELKIELNNRKKWMNLFQTPSGTLTICVPEDYSFDEVSLEVDAGELLVENINARELNINIGAGRAVIKRFTAEKLEAECGAGEADITGKAGRSVQIECGVGEVTYRAAGRQQDYNYELECGIGELQVGTDSYSGLTKKQKIDNNGSIKMEIECGIGEVTVTFDEEL